MKKIRLILCSLFLLPFIGLNAQTILDQEFSWENTNHCLSKESNACLYVKVEEDPRITQYTDGQFTAFLHQTIDALQLENTVNGFLKLKLLFLLGEPLCLHKLGTKDIHLTDSQVDILMDNFHSITSIGYGKQRKRLVNCQGILYLPIKGGVLQKQRSVNFKFKQ